ncbi:GTP cyclohydrolase II domain protein, partial [Vibrio parahaemolyticus VPTS-2010]
KWMPHLIRYLLRFLNSRNINILSMSKKVCCASVIR